MNERIQKLRELSVTTPVHIDLERAKIETDFYREKLLKKTKVMKLADQVYFSSLIFKISKNILI